MHWNDLNGGGMVLRSTVGTRGVRDLALVRVRLPEAGVGQLRHGRHQEAPRLDPEADRPGHPAPLLHSLVGVAVALVTGSRITKKPKIKAFRAFQSVSTA
ncbi:hypothetical protein [Streptomyces sp. HD]|uniref:hypothetical protein n=1 Tax=Streptomyces sp. HD TaxID=3020892 RepID=UPI003FA7C453